MILNVLCYCYVKVYLIVYVTVATVYNNLFDRHREVKSELK